MRASLFATLIVLPGFLLGTARADEALDRIAALRQQGSYDEALKSLDQLDQNQTLPVEVRQVLPLERAQTLMERAGQAGQSTDEVSRQLDRAAELFRAFARAHAEHSRSAEADSQYGEILLGKARAELARSRADEADDRRAQGQKGARDLIADARGGFERSFKRISADFAEYPVFIDREREPEQFRKRSQLEVALIRVQLELALCRYEEAQTWGEGTEEFRSGLAEASEEFIKIHQRYRSQVGGLYARLWQGKCYQELGDLGKALGIYNELLGHPSASTVMRHLQDQALQFRLACLNDDARRDYLITIQEADAWQTKAREADRRSAAGLAICFERARALKARADAPRTSREDRVALLKRALADVDFIVQQRGQYLSEARAMLAEIEAAVNKLTP